jgi:hypothetical protein
MKSRVRRPTSSSVLRMSARGDASERMADRVAGGDLRSRGNAVQTPRVGSEETNDAVPAGFEQRLGALDSDGEPLPASDRAFFEPRFGHDFSRVRIHAGPAADDLAHSVDARAFTLGQSIVFGAGQYPPTRHLLAHEMSHVVQQERMPAAVVHRAPPVDPDKEQFPWPATDPDRGFRPQDLAALQKQNVALSFSGSLSPMPADAQKILLDNIAATVRFALDPKDPTRVSELAKLEQEFIKKGKQSDFYNQPAGRVDSTDLYHGHVCAPQKVLDASSTLQKLRDTPYSGFGKTAGQKTPGEEIEAALGPMDAMPKTRPEARKVQQIADKHRPAFLKAFSDLMQALAKEATAGIMYHSWEVERPKVGGKRLDSDNPIRHIFTSFSTHTPEFRLEGKRDCATLLNFGFYVSRATGKITLLPGSEKQMVRAYEILNGP